jgi:RNA polymerase sigma factor (sigma-70 family)
VKSLAEGQFGPRFFQHGYGRLVALLARRLGRQNLARIEDAVQTALLRALETWTRSSPPASAEAWLYRVAINIYLEEVRREARHQTILESDMAAAEEDFIESDLAMVQMLVVCCDGQLSTKTSVALALKLLCGFGVPEIALRLFETESSIYKILQRGRAVLGRRSKSVLEVGDRQLQTRMPALCTGALHALLRRLQFAGRRGRCARRIVRRGHSACHAGGGNRTGSVAHAVRTVGPDALRSGAVAWPHRRLGGVAPAG